METMQQSDACLNHMLALKCELYTPETVQDPGKKVLILLRIREVERLGGDL